jgi:hypothetical protein
LEVLAEARKILDAKGVFSSSRSWIARWRCIPAPPAAGFATAVRKIRGDRRSRFVPVANPDVDLSSMLLAAGGVRYPQHA